MRVGPFGKVTSKGWVANFQSFASVNFAIWERTTCSFWPEIIVGVVTFKGGASWPFLSLDTLEVTEITVTVCVCVCVFEESLNAENPISLISLRNTKKKVYFFTIGPPCTLI